MYNIDMDRQIFTLAKVKSHFPRIGMRIVKSAVGVLLCYVVNLLRGDNGIVFYSQLAALWCMQDYVSETKSNAKQRTIGTFTGALWGLATILVYTHVRSVAMRFPEFLYAVMVSIGIVLVLYTTVVMNKKQASYFSCVVYLSIVVNHILDTNPYMFVLNRVLDTMIGIAIGVFVNCFSLPRKKNKDILFLSGLDDTLLSPNGQMSDYSRVELNRLIEDGAQFTISTIRTPASLMKPLDKVNLKLPVIVMDGAALFNIANKRYEYAYVISPVMGKQVKEFFEQNEIPYFANVIIDDLLIIYYQNTSHAGYNELIKRLRSSPYRNYIHRRVPDDESIVYFLVIDIQEKIAALYESLLQESFMERFKITITPSTVLPEYSLLKVYNHNATKENMIDYLKTKLHPERTVTFGTIEGRYDYCIEAGDFNKVVKLIKQEYEPLWFEN